MAAPARMNAREIRARADHARTRLAHLTLAFPVFGSVCILATVVIEIAGNGRRPDTAAVFAAFVQLWGLYGPYLVAITAYLWAQGRTSTGSEKAPNGWQMSVLAHSFTMRLIILVYSVPPLIYLVSGRDLEGANRIMGIYQSAVHTVTAAAITYFFARPEEGRAGAKKVDAGG